MVPLPALLILFCYPNDYPNYTSQAYLSLSILILGRYLKLDDVYVDDIREITAEHAMRRVVESSIEQEYVLCVSFALGYFGESSPSYFSLFY